MKWKVEYGFESVNGIVKKQYKIHEIMDIRTKCDVWNVLPLVYKRMFTGLQDSKAIDIYEGDILYCEQWNPKEYKVCFLDGAFCLCYNNETKTYAADLGMIKDSTGIHFEIKGNIYTK